jgi:chemotaxis protein MotB
MTQKNMPSDHSTSRPFSKNQQTSAEMVNKKPLTPSMSEFQHNSFVIEDSFFRSRLPRATHWSIAWSDLMMTMFILFLSMFIYQAAHQDFLVSNTPEIIGGSTTEAIDIEGDQNLITPIFPLSQTAPLITSGTVKMIEKTNIDEIDMDDELREQFMPPPAQSLNKEITTSQGEKTEEQAIPQIIPEKKEFPQSTTPTESASTTDIAEPAPILAPPPDNFSEIYSISQQALDENNLDKFASIELIPDKTMRIILTGDLLFSLGQAELSTQAKKSLEKIAAVIKDTPYLINVVGHTDNIPMHSSKFASNWELSVVRASSVARFLIDIMHMNPQQFIVSGYGSQRPLKANTTAKNRAANRRVEIIISKRLAPVTKATSTNLL